MTEREILDDRDLCRPDGRLNPDATGWARRPFIRPNLRGWGRTKRWEYWGILTPTHMVGVTVSSLDYAGVDGQRIGAFGDGCQGGVDGGRTAVVSVELGD